MELSANWVKESNGLFYRLSVIDCSEIECTGVYIIFNQDRVIKVGQGDVGARLACHQCDLCITQHSKVYSPLYVTWAQLPIKYLDGAEVFLANYYRPIVGERFPNVQPIRVNLPA
jgi:hypothetical protein